MAFSIVYSFILSRFLNVATIEINFMKGELFMTNGSNEMVMPVAHMYGNGNCGFGSWGRDGDGDGRYSEDSSYRRDRDAMGRFTSRDSAYDGYSRHNKEEMIEHLKEMMHNARSEEEKESYRRTIEQMQR